MTTIWAHLPNAAHIDRVIASMKVNIDTWDAAWNTLPKLQSRDAAMNAAWNAARGMVLVQVRDVAWNAARGATTGTGSRTAAQYTARYAILALCAYDDCAYMLDSDPGELAILAAFGDPRAVLLLSACKVFHSLKEVV